MDETGGDVFIEIDDLVLFFSHFLPASVLGAAFRSMHVTDPVTGFFSATHDLTGAETADPIRNSGAYAPAQDCIA